MELTDLNSVADALYDSDASIMRAGYPQSLADSAGRLADASGWTQAELDQHMLGTARAFSAAGVQPAAASSIYARIVDAALRPPDDATLDSWGSERSRLLREQYPSIEEGDRRIARVNEFLDEHPAFKELLLKGGGKNPRVMMDLVERADRLPVKGRGGK